MAPICRRCFLLNSLKFANILILLSAVALIVYSLWLDHMWFFYASHLYPAVDLASLQPWFIYTCLGVGIAVCLTSLCGSVVSHYFIASSALFAYIVTIGCLFCLEATLIHIIFFHTDLAAEITTYVGEHVEEIESFVKFHVQLSRVVILVVLIAQISIVVIAVVLWATSRGHRSRGIESHASQFTESFLVPIRLSQLVENTSTQPCLRCGILSTTTES